MRAARSSCEDLIERVAAEDRARALGDDVRARFRVLIASLDQQPLRLGARSGALQGKAAVQLLSMKHENGMTAGERPRPRDASALLVGSAIPDDHTSCLQGPLERIVRHGVVGSLDGESLDGGVKR